MKNRTNILVNDLDQAPKTGSHYEERMREMKSAISKNFLKYEIEEIEEAIRSYKEPSMRELSEQEREGGYNHVWFDLEAYEGGETIALYEIGERLVPVTHASQEVRHKHQKDDNEIYLGVGRHDSTTSNEDKDAHEVVGALIGKSGNDIKKRLKANGELRYIEDSEVDEEFLGHEAEEALRNGY